MHDTKTPKSCQRLYHRNPKTSKALYFEPIKSLVVNGKDWMEFPGGYIDIGIIDTMKDLMVNFIGAVVFSIIGFIYVKTRGKGRVASSFIPVVLSDEEIKEREDKEKSTK